jgi:DMSO reductase anchor subunit
MSNQTNLPVQKPIPTWRKVLAGILDLITVFFVGGYIIGKLTGETTDDGFSLSGAPALILFALVVAYFYFGWKKFGGTIWQRILRAR